MEQGAKFKHESVDNDISCNTVLLTPESIVSRKLSAGRWLLIDPETPNWAVVDDVGKKLLSLCDGVTSLGTAIGSLCSEFEADENLSASNILGFAKELVQDGILSTSPVLPARIDKHSIRGLSSLWVNVTNSCNLRCIHCFRGGESPSGQELSSREISDLIDQFEALDGEDLVVSGGEPFLRPDILDILGHARRRLARVTVITNGTLIDRRAAESLRRLEPITVQVSLDGATSCTNDQIRGYGAFESAIRGIGTLAEAGLTETLVAAMTLMKVNLHEVEGFAQLAERMSISRVHFPFFQAVGRGLSHREELEPTIRDVVNAVERIHMIRSRSFPRLAMPSIVERVWHIRGKRRDYCGAGISGWSVEPDGRVTPCAGLRGTANVAGNIRETTLEEIAYNSSVAQRFRSLHVIDDLECAACELRYMCGGGCHVERCDEAGEPRQHWSKCDLTKALYYHCMDVLAPRDVRAMPSDSQAYIPGAVDAFRDA